MVIKAYLHIPGIGRFPVDVETNETPKFLFSEVTFSDNLTVQTITVAPDWTEVSISPKILGLTKRKYNKSE